MRRSIRRWYRRVQGGVEAFPRSRRRTVAIAIIGSGLVLLGLLLLVLPGPGLLVLAIGLAVLSVEFVWAQLFVRQLRHFLVFCRKQWKSNSMRRARAPRAPRATLRKEPSV